MLGAFGTATLRLLDKKDQQQDAEEAQWRREAHRPAPVTGQRRDVRADYVAHSAADWHRQVKDGEHFCARLSREKIADNCRRHA